MRRPLNTLSKSRYSAVGTDSHGCEPSWRSSPPATFSIRSQHCSSVTGLLGSETMRGKSHQLEIGTKRLALRSNRTVTRQPVSFPRRQYRAALKAFAQRNWVLLMCFAALGLAVCLAFSLLLSGYLLGLAQGFFVSLLATLLLCAFHASTGSIWQMAGAWGEDSTTDELRKAKRRGLIWGFVNGVATSTGDVDHVVVTKRGGIVAVDSKYHAHLRSDTVQRDLVSAAASARRARLIMLSFGRRVEVAPLAVVWGGAQHLLGPEHKSLGNVVGGRELVPWLRALEGAHIDKATAKQILAELEDHRRRVHPLHRSPATATENAQLVSSN